MGDITDHDGGAKGQFQLILGTQIHGLADHDNLCPGVAIAQYPQVAEG